MSNELVSVYIPTRNRAELLERAIDSVLAQSYDNIEIIVCDDASSDSTPGLLARYASEHKNICCLRNDQPSGACRSRNRAISAARGKYITGLDDDDEFLPDRIQQFIAHYDPKWSCIAALPVAFTALGEAHVITRKSRVVTLDDMFYLNYLGNQVFCLTEDVREIGGFNADYPAWQDYELWTRLIARYGDALRIGQNTQRIHKDHGYQRISNADAVSRARTMYEAEYGDRMSSAHRRSQDMFLKLAHPQLGSPRLLDLLLLMGSPVSREVLGRYLHRAYPNTIHRLSRARHQLLG